MKGYRFLAIGNWIRGVAARCQCPGGVHTPLTTKKIGSNGKVQHTGIKKRLKESGAYPLALGRRIVACAIPGQPIQPSDCPDNDTALADRSTLHSRQRLVSSSVQPPVSSTKAIRVRKTVLKKTARAAGQRPVSSSVQHPVPHASAPFWLQPAASAITAGRSKRGPVAQQATSWRTPAATSTAGRGAHQCTPAVASTPGQSISAPWLTPTAER